MKRIAGIIFQPKGKLYAFDCCEIEVEKGTHVIVDTEEGLSLGVVEVCPVAYIEPAFKIPAEITLKKVISIASEEDILQGEKNRELEQIAYTYCLKCIKELGLKMNLFAVRCTFDAQKLTFFFTAQGRVDFRKLVKVLAKEFRTKIEMHQVGIRHQAKMLGGLGRCGRKVCCASFLDKFVTVSIRMAKEQNLSLNPTKISGLCGRLMCCLNFENETYQVLKEKFPKIGSIVKTKNVSGKVLRQNVIGNRVTILIGEDQEMEISLDEITQNINDLKEEK